MEKIFIHYKSKDDFLGNIDNISDTAIVFIQDSQQIYTHGTYYANAFLIQEITSESDGLVTIPTVDGYEYVAGTAYSSNSTQPVNLIRFGDYVYTGYYGGSALPSTSSPVTLLFTSIANCQVKLFYIKK